MPPGEYHLVVHVHLVNAAGEHLLQKRSLSKDLYPGEWDVTGGSVLAGETSLEGAIRETREEVGIDLAPDQMHFAGRLCGTTEIVDIWFATIRQGLHEMTPQPEEVDQLCFVSREVMLDLLQGRRPSNRCSEAHAPERLAEAWSSTYFALAVRAIQALTPP